MSPGSNRLTGPSLRERIRAQLADLKMPGALEALDGILAGVDGGTLPAPAAVEALLGAQIALRNNRLDHSRGYGAIGRSTQTIRSFCLSHLSERPLFHSLG